MKKKLLIVIVLVLLLTWTGCGQILADQKKEEQNLITDEEYVPSIPSLFQGKEDIHSINENATTFDFAELLAIENYPYGTWTVDKLISKFGIPEEVYGYKFPQYELVRVEASFTDIGITFAAEWATDFSFYKEGLEEGKYSLNESDKTIELFVTEVRVFGKERNLPREIKLGESTKTQIITAYGENPFSQYTSGKNNVECINYRYAFLEKTEEMWTEYEEPYIGGIYYFFDNNEKVLSRAIVSWMPGD